MFERFGLCPRMESVAGPVAAFGLGAGGNPDFSELFVSISSVRTMMVGGDPIMAPSLNNELCLKRRSLERTS